MAIISMNEATAQNKMFTFPMDHAATSTNTIGEGCAFSDVCTCTCSCPSCQGSYPVPVSYPTIAPALPTGQPTGHPTAAYTIFVSIVRSDCIIN